MYHIQCPMNEKIKKSETERGTEFYRVKMRGGPFQ